MVERAIAYTIMAAAVATIIAAVHDTDQRMQHAEQACAAKGGVLIDTSGGYKCYNRGEEAL